MTSLKIEDYQLVRMSKLELVRFKEEKAITMKDVLDVLPQYKAFNKKMIDRLERLEIDKANVINFLTQLRSAFIDGKIKYKESQYSLGNVSLKTTSFKANIKRVGKATDVDTSFLEYQNYGNYYISTGFGKDYELALHKIVTQDSFEDLLDIAESAYVLEVLKTYQDLQEQYRNLYDTDYRIYKEVEKFQNKSGVVVSDKIFNGKEVPADELKDVYETFKVVKEKVYQAYALADEINGKYNK